jgi:ABC-type multidrug transport system fused ATPase/permease subunit
MPPDLLKELSGYDTDVQKNRAQPRHIMEKLGYGPDNRLKIKVSTRDLPIYRDPAVILIDQLKEVYFDGELKMIDTTVYYPKIRRKDYTVGLNISQSGPDPDPILDALYGCGSSQNLVDYCNPEVDKLIEQQSIEADPGRRKQLVWAIERKLAEDGARPIIFYSRGGTCWQPYVKGLTIMVNSLHNGNRMEDVWRVIAPQEFALGLSQPGTDGSNPSPSSKESANFRSLSGGRIGVRNIASRSAWSPSYRYRIDATPALREMSLNVPAGQLVGIVGSSGSGRSTLARLIQRLYVPESGPVLIDGIDLALRDPAWLRRQIGVVLRENVLFNRTAREVGGHYAGGTTVALHVRTARLRKIAG